MVLFTSSEREKKRQYNQRCIQLEHASFTPLIFSAYCGCSRETYHFQNTHSERLAEKKSILPAVAMNWLRTKICFAQMRALIICVRGSRNPWHQHIFNSTGIALSYVYKLRLIGPISYPDECDLMVHPRKYNVIFSRMHFVTFLRI